METGEFSSYYHVGNCCALKHKLAQGKVAQGSPSPIPDPSPGSLCAGPGLIVESLNVDQVLNEKTSENADAGGIGEPLIPAVL